MLILRRLLLIKRRPYPSQIYCPAIPYATSSSSNVQIYANPISKLVIGAKMFSLSSSGIVLAAQPFLLPKFASLVTFVPFFASSLVFALFTPVLLHLLTRSCVFYITYDKNTSKFTAYTKSIFLRSKKIEFGEKDVSYSVSSLSFANMTVHNKIPLLVLESGFSDLEMKILLLGLDKPLKLQ
ncbi:hypothetical protein Aperf_G00000047466 [Anoplocephala perfoliata]